MLTSEPGVLYADDYLPAFSPVCTRCKHETGYRTCAAFPDGIPVEIWAGQNNHRSAYPGDGGIRFELKVTQKIPLDSDPKAGRIKTAG